jgi:hypothetical protein
VKGERAQAEAALAVERATAPRTADELRTLVQALHSVPLALETGDPAIRAAVYAELGMSVKYDPLQQRLIIKSRPAGACATERVGGGIDPISTPALLKGRVQLKAA